MRNSVLTKDNRLNLIFFALSDPTRRDIVSRLVTCEMSIGQLAENYDASLPAVSKHIQVLKDAELVTIEKQGRNRLVALNLETIDIAQIWLTTIDVETPFLERLEDEIDKINAGEL